MRLSLNASKELSSACLEIEHTATELIDMGSARRKEVMRKVIDESPMLDDERMHYMRLLLDGNPHLFYECVNYWGVAGRSSLKEVLMMLTSMIQMASRILGRWKSSCLWKMKLMRRFQ